MHEEPTPVADGATGGLAASLAHMGLLEGLPTGVLDGLAAAARERRYTPGEPILRQGEPSDGLYFLLAGAVHVFAHTEDGQLLLARLAPGECFGEMGVIDGEPRSATAVAVSLASCIFVPEDPFVDLLERVPLVSLRLLALLCRRLRRVNRLAAELPGTPERVQHSVEG